MNRTHYMILRAFGNLKTDDDRLRYYVEPSDGGGIEYVGETSEDAEEYIKSVDGVLDFIL